MKTEGWVLIGIFCLVVVVMLGFATIGIPHVQGLGTANPVP